MKWFVFLLVLFAGLPAVAGERRAYVQVGTLNVNGNRVIVVEDVTPPQRSSRSRITRSPLRPPYNPLFDGPRRIQTRSYAGNSTAQRRTGNPWYSAPTVYGGKPKYIENPFVTVDSDFFRELDRMHK